MSKTKLTWGDVMEAAMAAGFAVGPNAPVKRKNLVWCIDAILRELAKGKEAG